MALSTGLLLDVHARFVGVGSQGGVPTLIAPPHTPVAYGTPAFNIAFPDNQRRGAEAADTVRSITALGNCPSLIRIKVVAILHYLGPQ